MIIKGNSNSMASSVHGGNSVASGAGAAVVVVNNGGGDGGSLGPTLHWMVCRLMDDITEWNVGEPVSEVAGLVFGEGAYIGTKPGDELRETIMFEFYGTPVPCGMKIGIPINDVELNPVENVGAYMWPMDENYFPVGLETLPTPIPMEYEIVPTQIEGHTHPVLWITLPVATEPDESHYLIAGWSQAS